MIGIPLKKPGFYIVELASPRLGRALHGEDKAYYVATSVLVTNLSVHLKHGRESSLVWVTSLDRGKPVRECARHGARLHRASLVRGHHRCIGHRDSPGTGCLRPRQCRRCGDGTGVLLIAFARLGEDIAFTQSELERRHPALELQPPGDHRRRGSVDSAHRLRPAALSCRRNGQHEARRARAATAPAFACRRRAELPKAAEIEHSAAARARDSRRGSTRRHCGKHVVGPTGSEARDLPRHLVRRRDRVRRRASASKLSACRSCVPCWRGPESRS